MAERIPTKNARNIDENINLLRGEVKDFESRAAKPAPGLKENLEPEILSREDKIRELERSKLHEADTNRIVKIRERIAKIEYEVAHPTGDYKRGDPEQKILKLEDELHALERKIKGIPADETKTETEVKPPQPPIETVPSKTPKPEVEVPVIEPLPLDIPPVETPAVEPPAPGISPEAKKLEEEAQQGINENIEAAHPAHAEDGVEPLHIDPSEFREEEITPKEAHLMKLSDLIKSAKGKLYDAKESSEKGTRGEQLELNLENRNKELGAKAEKHGGVVEKSFRWIGEKYNKLNWKQKLAVGASLGLGAAVFTTVSLPIAFACISGLAIQRTFGMASMFLKFEKKGEGKEGFWASKEGAMLKAMGYGVVMGAAIGEAVHLASESAPGQVVHEWLNHHWPFSPTEVPVQNHVVPTSAGTDPTVGTVHPAAVHETVGLASTEIPHNPVEDVTASAPEMPSVDAAPGHGYEYMAKQLWREMHNSAKHFKLPDHTDPKSDLVQLFNADDKSIDGVVHRIAMDPQHGFFHADGTNTNVLISPHEHMTIGADGNIHMGEGNIDYGVQAPEGAHTTPVYHPEAPAGAPHENLMPEPEKVFGPAGGPHAPPVEAPVVHTVNYPPPAEHPAPPEVPVSRVEPPPPDSPPAPPIESHAPSVASHAPVESAGHEILNKFNIPVSIDHSHIYADPVAPEKMFVYGGSPAEQAKMITEYLTKDNYGVIYSADASGVHRVAWFLHYPDMKIAQSSPVRTNGLRALFSPFMKPPRPDEFGKIIK